MAVPICQMRNVPTDKIDWGWRWVHGSARGMNEPRWNAPGRRTATARESKPATAQPNASAQEELSNWRWARAHWNGTRRVAVYNRAPAG